MADADNLDVVIEDAERLLKGTEKEVKPEKTAEEIAAETKAAEEAEAARIAAEEEAARVKADEEDHSEKSKLGRKFKRLEEEQAKKISSIEETLNLIKERILVTSPEVVEEELELPENPTAEEIRDWGRKLREATLRDFEKQGADKSRQAQDADKKYAMDYAKMVEEMLDPEEDADIYKLMTDTKDLTYNQVYKRDAKEDFLINYRNATKSVLSKTKPAKVISLGKPAPGVTVPGATKIEAKKVDTSKWSPAEQEMARLIGEDSLAEMGIG